MAMFSTNKVYTVNYSKGIAASVGGVVVVSNPVFWLDNYNHTVKIKSIFFDMDFKDVNNVRIQESDLKNIYYSLVFNNVPAKMLANPFVRVDNPQAGTLRNGFGFTIYKPGQHLFDSFYIRESAGILLLFSSYELTTYTMSMQLIIEVEELTE